ncbi:MAG: aspartate kinase [Candidatus Pacebacteria bacterium]|nr:aspartate kinase [Candidatus Paceibacterota bacterium]
MSRIVMKFGGTSVATTERIRIVAARVAREVKAGHEVAVVVSAMAGETNKLVAYVDEVANGYGLLHDYSEYDSIVASGEIVTAGLTALALQGLGLKSRSWQGWQIPIRTDLAHGKARIDEINGELLIEAMEEGVIPVIAGFQGVNQLDRVATLGRGGSDTSAVAIAAAINADRCDIFTDVDGVYTADPRIVPKARKLQQITYEEMLELASVGAKVLQTRSVEMAMKHQVRVQVLSSFEDKPGTMMVEEEEMMEHELVSGITSDRNEAKVTLLELADRPGVAAGVFGPLNDANINVDMIVQNISVDGKTTDMTFTVPRIELARTLALFETQKTKLGYKAIQTDGNVAKVSVVGVGMRSHAGVALTMFQALGKESINILVISTSEIKISVLIEEKYTELAVRALHSAYGLDAQ